MIKLSSTPIFHLHYKLSLNVQGKAKPRLNRIYHEGETNELECVAGKLWIRTSIFALRIYTIQEPIEIEISLFDNN